MKELDVVYCMNGITAVKDLSIERLVSQYGENARRLWISAYKQSEIEFGKCRNGKDELDYIYTYHKRVRFATEKTELFYLKR